ncbi:MULTISPECIES: TetR/AcrR family transcriptional regulator [Aneurinibacillus]|jgi:AcrR family transcriptional regulator|uniref:Putative HTH-type transcriptional regulator YdgC n=1 Tax=Aneurinibacillus danicus TaxID=267746 RepID=A0A511V860_9BACL|nr:MULTISPECIES: TetR/AcrR family transcriptional regulator [Aneurinibacillus]GEN35127.1 putative HTH-type transcriptional regulator YdgC [Aneurinibacillus danicus]
MSKKRGRTEKGEKSRHRLMEAAAEEFARSGYHATKVSDIVKAAGLTQAAFYLYFPSKEAILSELVAEFKQQLRVFGDSGSNVTALAPSDVPAKMRQNIEDVLTFLLKNRELVRVALYESPEATVIHEEITGLIRENARKNWLAGHIREGLALDVVAECIFATIHASAERWLFNGEKSAKQLASEIAEVLQYGMLAHRPKNDLPKA